MTRELTAEERYAVNQLQALAIVWPETLTLLVTGSSRLVVIKSLDGDKEPVDADPIAVIDIPVDACA